MPLATTLRSIVESNASAWPLKFHVLSGGITEGTREKVFDSLPKGSASIRWVPVDLNLFREFSTVFYVSRMTYARLLIPRLFPDTVSRVLYLDADLLVMGDLGQLWETDLDGAVVGAVSDRNLDPALKAGAPGAKDLPEVRDYFNAGVLLIDLKRWREERVVENALEFLRGHPRSPYMDQDALNVACDKLWKKLDPRWNFQDRYDKEVSGLAPDRRPWIVHFVWCRKPWRPGVRNLDAQFYDAVRSRTLFPRTPSERLLDALRSGWGPFKYVLQGLRFARRFWRHFRPQRNHERP
jgi:lipopolysaccharide biosynthesis glycosyltransferase